MSIDRSLKVKAGLLKNRNVWTRAERLAALTKSRRWSDGDEVLGLPKVRTSLKSRTKKKKKEAEE